MDARHVIAVASQPQCRVAPNPGRIHSNASLCRDRKPLHALFLFLICDLQGFVQFRLSGERIHLDVDSLNEQLKVQGPDRLRCGLRATAMRALDAVTNLGRCHVAVVQMQSTSRWCCAGQPKQRYMQYSRREAAMFVQLRSQGELMFP